MDRFKMQNASKVGMNPKDGYNGDLPFREAGSVSGQIVRKTAGSVHNKCTSYSTNTKDSSIRGCLLPLYSSVCSSRNSFPNVILLNLENQYKVPRCRKWYGSGRG